MWQLSGGQRESSNWLSAKAKRESSTWLPGKIIWGTSCWLPTKVDSGSSSWLPAKVRWWSSSWLPAKVKWWPSSWLTAKFESGPSLWIPAKVEWGPSSLLPAKVEQGLSRWVRQPGCRAHFKIQKWPVILSHFPWSHVCWFVWYWLYVIASHSWDARIASKAIAASWWTGITSGKELRLLLILEAWLNVYFLFLISSSCSIASFQCLRSASKKHGRKDEDHLEIWQPRLISGCCSKFRKDDHECQILHHFLHLFVRFGKASHCSSTQMKGRR